MSETLYPTNMHLFTPLLLLAPTAQDWSAHPLPSLCTPPPHAQGVQLLGSGAHIALEPDLDTGVSIHEASLAPSLLTQLISREFGRSGLTLVPGSNPLLVRATDAEENQLRAIFSSLDEAGSLLNIRLQVSLLPSLPEELTSGSGFTGDSSAPAAGSAWSGEVRSGDSVAFGVRQDRSFVGGFDIEVATDAGIADPQRSSALYGETLHLTCCRVRGGEAVHVEGLLDLALLTSVGSFDPDTPDLGTVEQPRIAVCQIAFSGISTPEDPVRVVIRGADSFGDRTLIIAASTRPDPSTPSIGWAVRDLAFLDSPGLPLTAPQPGLRAMSAPKAKLPSLYSPSAPASLVGLLTERSSSLGTETGRIHSTERLLLIPAEDQAALARTDALVEAMEAPLLAEVLCVVRHGDTQVEFPTTYGRLARVLLGEEQPWLIDYTSEIASNSWMPSPVTEVAFDGVCVEGRSSTGALHARWWLASTTSVHVTNADVAHLGALQQPEREFTAGTERLGRGSRRVLASPHERLELSLQ